MQLEKSKRDQSVISFKQTSTAEYFENDSDFQEDLEKGALPKSKEQIQKEKMRISLREQELKEANHVYQKVQSLRKENLILCVSNFVLFVIFEVLLYNKHHEKANMYQIKILYLDANRWATGCLWLWALAATYHGIGAYIVKVKNMNLHFWADRLW